jgi:RNA polymerase sigma factor (sigma-70 family)
VNADARVEDLLRTLAPRVLAALIRRHGEFDACEDAVQEALLAAALQWPTEGLPENPQAWLFTVASRRLIDQLRSERSSRRRALIDAARTPLAQVVAAPHHELAPEADDTLLLLFLCCHPALSPTSQVALTLRAFGGLSTVEIAQAFMVAESAMAQRISRAKQAIKTAGISLELPAAPERDGRLQAVLHVLYLIFNEGYVASAGAELQRVELSHEAIRLARELHRLLPDEGEIAGLLALMLLTDARRLARIGVDGSIIPLTEQSRELWDRATLQEGISLLSAALERTPLGPYQLQAAIAAVHGEAARAQDTDWPQILALYELLERAAPNPMVTLNRAVALAMVHGPRAGLQLIEELADAGHLSGHHRLHAVRAHLLEMSGESARARAEYLAAARLTTSFPERRHLEIRADRLTDAQLMASSRSYSISGSGSCGCEAPA